MQTSNRLLNLDAVINLLLGGLLIWYPSKLVQMFGLPVLGQRFFTLVLGGVLVGIGIALLIETQRTGQGLVGLGLGGAIAINVSGAIGLSAGLLSADLNLTSSGTIFLWGLVLLLGGVSGLEWGAWWRAR